MHTQALEKVLVLGSNSFAGADFVDYLLTKNHLVYGVNRSQEPSNIFLPYKRNNNFHNYTFFKYDINLHTEQIIQIVKEQKIPYVVNFAAQGMVGESWLKPEDWFQTNVVSNIKIHDQLRKFDFLKKFVQMSTPEVYGNCTQLVKESQVFAPSTPYAVSKAACDLSLESFRNFYNFPVVYTRSANFFGPHQQLYRIIPRTIIYALLGKQLELHGGGASVRSFIHIRDVSEGTYNAMHFGEPGSIFHFSTDLQQSIKEIVYKIAEILNVKVDSFVKIVVERHHN